MKLACRKIARGIGGKLFILFQNSFNARLVLVGMTQWHLRSARVHGIVIRGGQKVLRNAVYGYAKCIKYWVTSCKHCLCRGPINICNWSCRDRSPATGDADLNGRSIYPSTLQTMVQYLADRFASGWITCRWCQQDDAMTHIVLDICELFKNCLSSILCNQVWQDSSVISNSKTSFGTMTWIVNQTNR